MTNWTGRNNTTVYNKDVFIVLHNIVQWTILKDIGNLKWKPYFLTEAIITLPEKQETKRCISWNQYADKANSSITNKGAVYYEIKPTFKYPKTNVQIKQLGT